MELPLTVMERTMGGAAFGGKNRDSLRQVWAPTRHQEKRLSIYIVGYRLGAREENGTEDTVVAGSMILKPMRRMRIASGVSVAREEKRSWS